MHHPKTAIFDVICIFYLFMHRILRQHNKKALFQQDKNLKKKSDCKKILQY